MAWIELYTNDLPSNDNRMANCGAWLHYARSIKWKLYRFYRFQEQMRLNETNLGANTEQINSLNGSKKGFFFLDKNFMPKSDKNLTEKR